MKSMISVDVEDAVSLAMRNFYGQRIKPTERVVHNTIRFLELFERCQTKATFFLLGEVVEAYPDLVRKIDQAGHEIGVHGFSHVEFIKMNREQAFQEVSRAKQVIEDITGKVVKGHRAPAFSINKETSWVFEVLADAGFVYDSSVMPVKSRHYGWPGFDKGIHELTLPSGRTLIEVPLSVCSIFGRVMPVCGGGYFRLLPFSLTRYAFKKVTRERPVVMYFHPHELDLGPYPDFYLNQIQRGGLKKRLRIKSYWLNRATVEKKIAKILSLYQLGPIWDVIKGRKGVPV